jgi:hypothetical protein
VGYCFEGMDQSSWKKKLPGKNPLEHKKMSHARRIELGILTLAYMKEYVAKWTLANTSATEVEQQAAYKAELSAYCVSQGHG